MRPRQRDHIAGSEDFWQRGGMIAQRLDGKLDLPGTGRGTDCERMRRKEGLFAGDFQECELSGLILQFFTDGRRRDFQRAGGHFPKLRDPVTCSERAALIEKYAIDGRQHARRDDENHPQAEGIERKHQIPGTDGIMDDPENKRNQHQLVQEFPFLIIQFHGNDGQDRQPGEQQQAIFAGAFADVADFDAEQPGRFRFHGPDHADFPQVDRQFMNPDQGQRRNAQIFVGNIGLVHTAKNSVDPAIPGGDEKNPGKEHEAPCGQQMRNLLINRLQPDRLHCVPGQSGDKDGKQNQQNRGSVAQTNSPPLPCRNDSQFQSIISPDRRQFFVRLRADNEWKGPSKRICRSRREYYGGIGGK